MVAQRRSIPSLASLGRLPGRLAVVRGHRQPHARPADPAATAGQPRRHQRAALGQQGRGGGDAGARRAEGPAAGARGAAFGEPYGLGEGTVALVGLAAFLGHLWPVFFRFQGGKGVATAAGVLFGINPGSGLATLATWLIIAVLLPLLVAGVDRRRGVRAVLSAADLGRRAGRPGDPGDEPAARLAPPRQHRAALRRHREPARHAACSFARARAGASRPRQARAACAALASIAKGWR